MTQQSTRIVLFTLVALGLSSACSGKEKKELQTAKDTNVLDDGLPDWYDDPCVGQPVDALCAVGESNFAATDVEAAKSESETIAKGKISEQLETNVTQLNERVNNAVRDAAGRPVSDTSMKNVTRSLADNQLRGLRYEYFYYPNRTEPQRVYVRAMLSVDNQALSTELLEEVRAAAARENIDLSHEDSMVRLDRVREEYLQERGGKR